MAMKDYSEDVLIQAPTAELLEKQLGWQTVFAQDDEDFGPDSLLGRCNDTEVVLGREVLAALKRLNPGLSAEACSQALAQVLQDDITKTLISMNEEKYKLLRDGVPVKYRDAAGRLVDKRLRLIDFDHPEKNRYQAVRELWVIVEDVQARHRGLFPHPGLFDCDAEESAVTAIYNKLQDARESPDVSALLQDLYEVVDTALTTDGKPAHPLHCTGWQLRPFSAARDSARLGRHLPRRRAGQRGHRR